MLLWKLLLFITILLIFVMVFSRKNKHETYIENMRKTISEKYYGQKFPQCKSVLNSNSYGLVADASIVCKTTDNLPATPIFYYEDFPEDFMTNGWVFVNLDITDFSRFNDPYSPQFIACKTHQAYNILSNKFPDKTVIYTGFTSFDKYNDSIEKDYSKFIHIAGKSPFKGTENLVKTWIKHPEWPTLIIVARGEPEIGCKKILNSLEYKPLNIQFIFDFLPEENLDKLSNKIGIHICSSDHEGFGHYLHEAKALGSVVLYTNAPPMNETFVDGYNGIAIDCNFSHLRNNICPVYKITEEGLEKAVNQVLQMSTEELREMGILARESFLEEKEKFRTNLTSAILGHNRIPKIIHHVWISKEDHYKDVDIPKKYEKYLESWKIHNADFNFMYWSGEKILNLIQTHFPEFLLFYKNLKLISKCDFARFAITYIYGGLYSDMDYMCRNNIQNLIKGESYFIFEPINHFKVVNSKLITNAIFALYPKSNIGYDFLVYMTKQRSGDILKDTGTICLYRYLKMCPYKVLYGKTCDLISSDNKGYAPQCNGEYNNYATTVWSDGSGWGNDYNTIEIDNLPFKVVKNPIDNSSLRIEKTLNTDIQVNYNKYISEVLEDPMEAIFIAHALKNKNSLDIVYFTNKNVEICNVVENTALMNAIPNIKISNQNKWSNFLDGSDLIWEVSEFTKKNWPDLMYDLPEKRKIFELCKNLKHNHGVIDVGAHIGDLAIPLAKALANCGRSDVTVYAIDPSKDKCDFMRRMAKYNDISNIVILQLGLSDTDKNLSKTTKNVGNNTGSYVWESGNDVFFTTADKLLEKNVIGPIGLYHIDVETHELQTLKGSQNLIRKYKPLITIEIFVDNNKGNKCKDSSSSPYCKEVFDLIMSIESSYKVTGFLPNNDLIFQVKE